MLNNFCGAKKVYFAYGYTDLRRGIDGLATIVEQQFQLAPLHRHSVSVLWQTNRQNQGTLLGRRRLFTALQTPRKRQVPVVLQRERSTQHYAVAVPLVNGRFKYSVAEGEPQNRNNKGNTAQKSVAIKSQDVI